MKSQWYALSILMFLLSFLSFPVFAGNKSYLTYQGRIIKSDGSPVNGASVSMTVQIVAPTGCLLWEQNVGPVDFSNSKGTFTVTVGNGVNTAAGALTWDQIFQNGVALGGGALTGCGGTYTGAATDDRTLYMVFNDGSGNQTVGPVAIKTTTNNSMLAGFPFYGVPTNGQTMAFDDTNDYWYPYTPAGGGSLNSVGLAVPAIFSVGATSPVTGAGGTITMSLANQSANTIFAGPSSGGPAAPTFRALVPNDITSALPAQATHAGKFLQTDGAGNLSWQTSGGAGDITDVVAGTALTGGAASGSATLNVDVGLGASKIPQVGGSAISANSIILSNGTGNLTHQTLTNGQLLIGSTGFAPVAATLTGTANQINIATGSGSITLSTPQDIHTGASPTFNALTLSTALPIASGGTGQATATAAMNALDPLTTKGDILVHNGTDSIRLPVGTDTWVLTADSAQASGVKWAVAASGADNLGNHTATTNLQMSGNTIYGNSTASGNLTLDSTSNGTKGYVNINPTGGNVGIGTPTPSNNLTVYSTTSAYGLTVDGTTNPAISIKENGTLRGYIGTPTGAGGFITGSSAGDVAITSSGGNIHMSTNGAAGSYLTINSTGNVGIGRISPQSKLDVNGIIRATDICDENGANCKDISSGWGSGGSVTSVDVSAPFMTSSGAVTTSGTVALSYSNQTANTVLAGPGVGPGAGAPTFRSLVAADVPNLDASKITGGTLTVDRGGTGAASLGSGNILIGNGTGAVTSLAAGVAGNVVYSTGVSTWASGTPDTANLVDKSSTQTITGAKAFSNYLQMNAQNEVRFADGDSSNYVALRAPTTVGTNVTWTLPDADGANGQVLQTNGTGALSWTTASGGIGGGGFTNMQVFTTTGSTDWVAPAGVTKVYVEMWGGGGGAGGSNLSWGGGAGGYAAGIYSVTPLSTYKVIVGVGGAGGNPNAGSAGGTSCFSTNTCASGQMTTANGGAGGSASPGGAGGSASGTFSLSGQPGYNAQGGSSPRGGVGGLLSTGTGVAQIPGGGGGNGAALDPGGAGARGQVVLYWSTASGAGTGTVSNVTSSNSYLTITNPTTTPDLTINVGTGANTVAAGDDSRIVNAVQKDGSVAMTGGLKFATWTTAGRPGAPVAGQTGFNTTDSVLESWEGTSWVRGGLSSVSNSANLANGKVWIGDGTGKAQEQTLSQDVTITNTGVATVSRIQNRAVASAAPSLGSFLKWNNTLSQWEPTVYASCNATNKLMHYNSITDTWTCDDISMNSLDPLTTKGDILVHNGTDSIRLPVGTDTWVLTADSAQASGVKWAAAGGADNLGNHTATANIQLNGNWLSNDGGNEGIRIDNNGNVGIGTVAPQNKLDVTNANSQIRFGATATDDGGYLVSVAGSHSVLAGGANWNGTNWVAKSTSASAFGNYLGAITFTTNSGLTVGNTYTPLERMRIDSTGNVGIGTTSPSAALDVNGTIIGRSISNATSTVDYLTGNIQYTTSDCGAFNLHNMKSGGSYSFIVQGTNSATCSFSAYSDAGTTSLTVHMPSDHSSTTNGTHTVYTFMVAGTHIYVSWIPGY